MGRSQAIRGWTEECPTNSCLCLILSMCCCLVVVARWREEGAERATESSVDPIRTLTGSSVRVSVSSLSSNRQHSSETLASWVCSLSLLSVCAFDTPAPRSLLRNAVQALLRFFEVCRQKGWPGWLLC